MSARPSHPSHGPLTTHPAARSRTSTIVSPPPPTRQSSRSQAASQPGQQSRNQLTRTKRDQTIASKPHTPGSPGSDIEQPDSSVEGRDPGARNERPDRGAGLGTTTHAIEADDRLRRGSRSPPCNGAGMRGVAHLQAIEGDEVDLDAEAWATPRMPAPLRGAFGKPPAPTRSPARTKSCPHDPPGSSKPSREIRLARTRWPTPCRRPRKPRSARTARPSAPSGRAAASPGVRRSPRTGVPG